MKNIIILLTFFFAIFVSSCSNDEKVNYNEVLSGNYTSTGSDNKVTIRINSNNTYSYSQTINGIDNIISATGNWRYNETDGIIYFEISDVDGDNVVENGVVEIKNGKASIYIDNITFSK